MSTHQLRLSQARLPQSRLFAKAQALLVLAALALPSSAATLSLSVSSESIHTDMPFTLTLQADGFQEDPTPAAPPLAIDGCEVTFLGVSPSVSSHVQIVNGRRSEWREVKFNYQWRVIARRAGRYTVPALRVEQGVLAATTPVATIQVNDVPSSADMVVRLGLPKRAVWVGEKFDVAIEWLLNREVESHEFAVPLFHLDGVQVEAPANSQQSMRFAAGTGEVVLPVRRSTVQEGGRRYTRFLFTASVTINRAGPLDLDPVRVVARLETGATRDAWGFRRPRYELFRAEGQQRRLTVRPLPQAGRPSTFVNAIGGGYSIDVQASRTVVAVGEPIDLTIRIRGDGPLTGLSLPPLTGTDALPPTQFGVTDASPAGAIDEQTNSKRFVVVVRVKSETVQEIPSIAFAYFDPSAGEYRTVSSEPIALSVGAASTIGAGDVVAATPTADPQTTHEQDRERAMGSVATLHGADMSLSAPEQTFAERWDNHTPPALTAALYGIPALGFALALWLSRTGKRRAQASEVRQALRSVERALANGAPAQEAAPTIHAAMRRLAQATNANLTACKALETLQTSAFDPTKGKSVVPDDLLTELREVARQWSKKPRQSSGQRDLAAGSAVAALVIALSIALLANLPAQAAESMAADEARILYQSALAETDRLQRVRRFASAEQAFRRLAAAHPDAPNLQADWGNAALGAQDRGRAVLAYRRALRTAPGDERARANLDWLRDQLPHWLPRPATDTLDSLLFWRERYTVVQLQVAAAGAFAIGLLLLTPWSPGQPRALRPLGIASLLIWAAVGLSALLVEDEANAAVVVQDGAILRSADSAGAAPAFTEQLPAGTEVVALEARDSWLRISLADGTRGWLRANAVERVESVTP